MLSVVRHLLPVCVRKILPAEEILVYAVADIEETAIKKSAACSGN